MTEPTIQIEIDPAAAAAYIELTQEPVERTDEFTPEIMVDLDAFGMVVGIELLSLSADLDEGQRADFVRRYHVAAPITDMIPIAFGAVSDWTRQNVQRTSSSGSASDVQHGVLRPAAPARLTPCP